MRKGNLLSEKVSKTLNGVRKTLEAELRASSSTTKWCEEKKKREERREKHERLNRGAGVGANTSQCPWQQQCISRNSNTITT